MKNSQDEYEAFMQKVHDWEKQKNENLAGRVKSKNADTEAIGRQTTGRNSRGSRTCR